MTKKQNKARLKKTRPVAGDKDASISRRRMLLTTGIAAGTVVAIGGGMALLSETTPAMAQEVIVYKDPSWDNNDTIRIFLGNRFG